jgi:hypothetical protein
VKILVTSYSAFDYLCDESYFVQSIGFLKCPTLRDIRKVTFNVFLFLTNVLSSSLEDILELYKTLEEFNDMWHMGDKRITSPYFLLLYKDIDTMFRLLTIFIDGEIEFCAETMSFNIFKTIDRNKEQVGCLNDDNFDLFREQAQYILGIKSIEDKEQKFKNKIAQKIYDKLQTHAKEQNKNSDKNYTFDNMIKKYCTHNKVGINILNVWDMTYYQFMQMFSEYCNGRQCDFNDMMAANTFSYKKSTDYKPLEYMNIMKNN